MGGGVRIPRIPRFQTATAMDKNQVENRKFFGKDLDRQIPFFALPDAFRYIFMEYLFMENSF